ncbi:uncharacterized protein LOC115627874 [Scaptodrosophila lebanonensis]|uniref:Uncharacterized protein LOC115627874 n=1 Tax=Drosophila lebanonensis TaxID=7225 RepID=A0A6J2TWR6_DROLE|nr:uncharacterized protein LOC115627874 [Scaptodrosophila lebanonensis]
MRRLRAFRASSSASAVAQTPHVPSLPHHPQNTLSLIRLLALASVIGPQIRCIFCLTPASGLAEPTLAAANTENNSSYFDAFSTTHTISSTAFSAAHTNTNTNTSASVSASGSQTSAETLPPLPIQTSPLLVYTPTTSTRSYQQYPRKTSVRMQAGSESLSSSSSSSTIFSTPIKNPSDDSDHTDHAEGGSTGAMDSNLSGLTTAATTLKSARSTMKEPIDSARSRNHWSLGVTDSERPRTFRSKHHHEHHWGPFFEEPLNSAASGDNLVSSAHLFTEAVLNCRVGMLKDKTVMWVRRTTEKVSLLTVGNVTYSGDPRIRVKFQYPNNWRLLINPTRREDAGIYMCQVSTHPPRVFTTNLTILEPPLRVIDEHERDVGDRYYKSGSTVDLQCQVSRNFFQKERINILKSTESQSSVKYSTTLNALNDTASDLGLIGNTNQTHTKVSSQTLEKYFTNFITWAKDEEPLQALTSKRSSVSDKWLNSRISIPDAKLSDSGNYSCSLGRLFTVIVQVQVLTGELPAAVQHNFAPIRTTMWPPLLWICLCIVSLLGIF